MKKDSVYTSKCGTFIFIPSCGISFTDHEELPFSPKTVSEEGKKFVSELICQSDFGCVADFTSLVGGGKSAKDFLREYSAHVRKENPMEVIMEKGGHICQPYVPRIHNELARKYQE